MSTRTQTTQQAILDATRELLAEGGVRKLTVEGVAARAGVAKTTIYRRWRSRDELALAVLLAERQAPPGGFCASPSCGRPFVNTGRGAARRYCSATCGTRERVARHRTNEPAGP